MTPFSHGWNVRIVRGMHPQQPMPYPQYAPYVPPRARPTTNVDAVASLVFSLLWLAGLGSIAGIILGHYAHRRIRKTGQRGDGLATAGLVLGYLGLIPHATILIVGIINYAIS